MKYHIIIFICVYTLFETTQAHKTDNLKLVHVFFRHGSRTPEFKDLYSNDPYKLEHYAPMGWGQLTNVGKQRAYKLGKLLRKKYDSFLGQIYTPELVTAQSTDFDRTKMSALLLLAGLFKPAPSQAWDDEVTWLPIPYEYDKAKYDFTLRRPIHYCPTYFKELEEVLSSPHVQGILKENRDTLNYISKHAGKPMKKLSDMFQVYQVLCAQLNLNFTLPEWATPIYPEIERLATLQCELENFNTVLKRLNGGRMLDIVIKQMVAKSQNKLTPNERKMFLYSGHENNVINILAALNLYKPHFPKYSAAVIIELHKLSKDKNYGVKVYYSRDVNADPEEQKLEGCDVMCPLNDFIKLTKLHVPFNYTAECDSNISLD